METDICCLVFFQSVLVLKWASSQQTGMGLNIPTHSLLLGKCFSRGNLSYEVTELTYPRPADEGCSCLSPCQPWASSFPFPAAICWSWCVAAPLNHLCCGLLADKAASWNQCYSEEYSNIVSPLLYKYLYFKRPFETYPSVRGVGLGRWEVRPACRRGLKSLV